MKRALTTLTLIVSALAVHAQDMHIIPFDAAPMTVNPAFTGMFQGKLRVAGGYQNVYENTAVPFASYYVSADAPVLTMRNGSYLAAGIQLLEDKAGDGNLSDFYGTASLAYHQAIGDVHSADRADIAIGVQGGYTQQTIDLVDLYFGNQFNNAVTPPGTSVQYHLGLGNSVNYYFVSTGISFSQNIGRQFNYALAFSANNMNQPTDYLEKTQNEKVGIVKNYIASFGAGWSITQRLTLRPAALVEFTSSNDNVIFGNEFQYATNLHHRSLFRNVFVAAWYRSGDIYRVTAGTQIGSCRIETGYDFSYQSNAVGGFELQLQYIAIGRKPRSRNIPCARF